MNTEIKQHYDALIEQLCKYSVINSEHKFYSGSQKNLNNNPKVRQQLWDLTPFAKPDDNYQIRVMYILNYLTDLPKCKTCGCDVGPSKVYEQRGKFAEYCSRACVNYTTNQQKSRQTCIEKYGVDNGAKTEAAKEKAKATNREKYGADYAQQTQEGKDKITQAMQNTYGVDRPLQKKEFKDKAVATNMERYGVTNPMRDDGVQEKQKQTVRERYGVDNVFASKEIQEKIKQTCIEKYGVENPSSLESVKLKIRQTTKERYGVENVMKLPEFKKRVDDTNMERYGRTRAIQNDEMKSKIKQQFIDEYNVEHPAKAHISADTKAKLLDGTWLKQQHHDEKKTHSRIAKELGVSQSYLSEVMEAHGIETKFLFSSQAERDINDFINSLGVSTIQNTRTLISPLEIDIYVPSHNLAIEYNGIYWHNSNARDASYHLNKTNLCKQKGIRLFHISEAFWDDREDIIKSNIKAALNIYNTTINANDCSLYELDAESSEQFFEENHINGYIPTTLTIGLVCDNIIVAAASFQQHEEMWEMVQFCNKCEYNVIHSLDTLIKTFKTEVGNVVLIYSVDIGIESSEIYENIGFVNIGEVEPIEIKGVFNCGYELLLI